MDITEILVKYYKGREWKLNGDSYEALEFLDGGPVISQAELEEKNAILIKKKAGNQYAEDRRRAYELEGISRERLVDAMWALLVEKDSSDVDAIQAIRASIKSQILKGEMNV